MQRQNLQVGPAAKVSRARLAAAAVLAVALGACGMTDADKAANAFMNDLKAGDYPAAFALETPAMQQKFGGSVATMEAQVKKFGQQPTEWSFNKINVTNGVAKLHGSATFTGAVKGAVDLELVEQNGKWLVASAAFAK
jgi:hypothetical protein